MNIIIPMIANTITAPVIPNKGQLNEPDDSAGVEPGVGVTVGTTGVFCSSTLIVVTGIVVWTAATGVTVLVSGLAVVSGTGVVVGVVSGTTSVVVIIGVVVVVVTTVVVVEVVLAK